MAMQKLQPKVKELQNRYKNDQEKAQLEVARLYREAQVHLSQVSHFQPSMVQGAVKTGAHHELHSRAEQCLRLAGQPTGWLPADPRYHPRVHWTVQVTCASLTCRGLLHATQSHNLQYAPAHVMLMFMTHPFVCVQSVVKCCGRRAADRGLLLDPLAGWSHHAGCTESGTQCSGRVLGCLSPFCSVVAH